MQKHQLWMDNRSYQQHLQVLQKIKSRKNHSANARKTARQYQNSKNVLFEPFEKQNKFSPHQSIIKQNRISNLYFNKQQPAAQHSYQQPFIQTQRIHRQNYPNQKQSQIDFKQFSQLKQQFITSRNAFSKSQNFINKTKKYNNLQSKKPHNMQSKKAHNIQNCMNMSLKQQQLLWNNFLLGKRILQTTPVISKRKHDIQYEKHKQLLRSRTTKKVHQNSNFRLRKLHQHNDKIYKISDDHRIQNNLHKTYMVTLVIQSIQIFKYKFSSFQNIILTMKCPNKIVQSTGQASGQNTKAKITKQVSQCIPSSALTSYNFFFTYKRKQFEQNIPIIIEIKNVKSLNVISIGTFSFQFNNIKDVLMNQANMYNFGKHIGVVKFNAHYGKKDNFLSHIG